MTSSSGTRRIIYALPLTVFVVAAASAASGEKVTLEDGTTCTLIEGNASAGKGVTSSITAGSGQVTGSTTIDGQTSTTHSSGAGTSSSAGASASTDGTGESFASSSITRPDGTVITRNSDGTCEVMKPKQP